MLLARIQIVTGRHRGVRTHVEVRLDSDGTPSYLPIADPFDPDAATTIATTGRYRPRTPRSWFRAGPGSFSGWRTTPDRPTGCYHRRRSTSRPTRLPRRVRPSRSVRDTTKSMPRQKIAVVIGAPARNLTRDNALAAVFGYTCANDVTDRAAQASDSLWTEAKSRDTYTPLGPWIRTDLDPADLAVQLGDDTGLDPPASTAGLARGVVDVLVYLSSVMTLHPGDVVLAGAAGPSRRLCPGGTSRIIVPAIGELTNPVVTVGAASAQTTCAASAATSSIRNEAGTGGHSGCHRSAS